MPVYSWHRCIPVQYTVYLHQDKPVNAYLPLFWAFIILCMLAGLRLTYQAIYKTSAFRSLPRILTHLYEDQIWHF